jgi:hypothetical protein
MDIPAGAIRCPHCQSDIRPRVEDKPLTIILLVLVLGRFSLLMLAVGAFCLYPLLFGN